MGGRGKGGSGRGDHALAQRGSEGHGSGEARDGGRWRRDVQSAGDPASAPANLRSPRALGLATGAFPHHVRVRWAVAGYKGLRPSGRPPFWGSFRGKFGCPVACRVTFSPRAVGLGRGRTRISRTTVVYLARPCPGAAGNVTGGCFKATRTDYIFLLLCSFHPRLNFLGERQAGHEENKQASATSKPLKGS